MKTVALFGGSFNPPHHGHFEMARYIHTALQADEVWMVFSVNRLKEAGRYAPLEHRMNMAAIMAQDYADVPLVFSDIESRENSTHQTVDTLTALKCDNPDTHFIWVMGADNLEEFHKWAQYDRIIENFPIAVVDRPPYTALAMKGRTALEYGFLKTNNPLELKTQECGWCFLGNPQIDISSSHLLQAIREGEPNFDGRFNEVVDYIKENNLYGVGFAPKEVIPFSYPKSLTL